MKVIICPKCRISPEITTTEIKCPKCGRKSIGVDLSDTVTKWNKEEYADAGKPAQVVVKDIDAIKEEAKAEIECEATDKEIAESFIEDVEAVKDQLPEKKTAKKPAKTEKKPAKKGAK